MRNFIPFAFILFVGCAQTELEEQKTKGSHSIFGGYSCNECGHGIVLNADSTYNYYWGGCLDSGRDTGKYSIKYDTLFFRSFLKENRNIGKKQTDTSVFVWRGHGQITPITNEKYLIRNNRIYYRIINGKYDTTFFWKKQLNDSL